MTMLIQPADTANFLNTSFDIYSLNGTRWLRGDQIRATLVIPATTFKRIFKSHRSEFTPDMTGIITVPTPGGAQQTRIFSPRGATLIAMLAKSERAAAFRAWVLDVLEAKAHPTLQDELTTALARRLRVVARHVLRAQPDWRRIIAYKRRGLSNAEIAKLMDHGSSWVRKALREMEAFGLVEPPADLPVRRAQAIAMRRALPAPAAALGAAFMDNGGSAAGECHHG